MRELNDEQGRTRVVIESVRPQIDGGRFPVKRIVGDTVVVEADVFADGHEEISARLLCRAPSASDWLAVPLRPLGNDRWRAEFAVNELGTYGFTVEGWIDSFQTWRHDFAKRVAAGQNVEVDLQIGAAFI